MLNHPQLIRFAFAVLIAFGLLTSLALIDDGIRNLWIREGRDEIEVSLERKDEYTVVSTRQISLDTESIAKIAFGLAVAGGTFRGGQYLKNRGINL